MIDREEVVAELDRVRRDYRALLDSADAGDLRRRAHRGECASSSPTAASHSTTAPAQDRRRRRELGSWGAQRPCRRIVRAVFASLPDSTGVLAHRRGAFERIGLLLADWQQTRTRLADTETRMRTVLEELKLTELVTSITGLSALGAAAILAETGDLTRFASARAVVKHAGLAPREKLSGNYTGRTKMTGQGRPGLRLAAWRAVWGAQRAGPVYAARYST